MQTSSETSLEMTHLKINTKLNTFLSNLTGTQKSIIEKLRMIILSVDKDIDEDINWGSLSYKCGEGFCEFRTGSNKIGIVFYKGKNIYDKYGYLKDTGSSTMGMFIEKPHKIKEDVITDYVKQAVLLTRKSFLL
ncbi:MAG TPA: DUF1801 domain-containing protein [Bacteroidia bacterium]|nr:DUF1801 domain-containing protein [Bacteroidia bacterium]HNT80500.1 DUF1801 domain-containing protein [Bacteroidia bacterium]